MIPPGMSPKPMWQESHNAHGSSWRPVYDTGCFLGGKSLGLQNSEKNGQARCFFPLFSLGILSSLEKIYVGSSSCTPHPSHMKVAWKTSKVSSTAGTVETTFNNRNHPRIKQYKIRCLFPQEKRRIFPLPDQKKDIRQELVGGFNPFEKY